MDCLLLARIPSPSGRILQFSVLGTQALLWTRRGACSSWATRATPANLASQGSNLKCFSLVHRNLRDKNTSVETSFVFGVDLKEVLSKTHTLCIWPWVSHVTSLLQCFHRWDGIITDVQRTKIMCVSTVCELKAPWKCGQKGWKHLSSWLLFKHGQPKIPWGWKSSRHPSIH